MDMFWWASEKRLARHGDFGVSKLVVSMYLHVNFHAFVGRLQARVGPGIIFLRKRRCIYHYESTYNLDVG